MAVPFVQGRLSNERISADIATECGHCGEALEFNVDSEGAFRAGSGSGQMLVFVPSVDWANFDGPNIIDAY